MIALFFLVWRVAFFIPLFFSRFIVIRTGFIAPLPWANFDGVHYLNIATQGYTTDARFMPLYPLAIKLFSFLFPSSFITGFALSNIFFLASLFALKKVLALDYGKKRIMQTIITLLIFPTSFFFGSVYSESLFFLLILLSFYFSRKKQWLPAGIFGALASLTKVVGIILLPVLLVEYFLQKQKSVKAFLGIILVPAGTILYAVYNFVRWGNPLYFLAAQGELNNGRSVAPVILPPQLMYRYIKILFTVSPTQYDWWIAFLEFGVFWLGVIFVYVLWRKKARLSYLVYVVLGILAPAMSGTLTGFPRYILPLFPLFVALSGVKNRTFQVLYVGISFLLSFTLLALFARGYYVA
jgi:Gpi18-like mannosyltransferase